MAAGAATMLILGYPAAAAHAQETPNFVAAAVAHSGRIPDRIYDRAWMPAEVMTFARVKPGDIVVDLVPHEGYFTRILSRISGPRGHVYPVVPRFGQQALPTARTDSAAIQAERSEYRKALDAALAVADVTAYNNVRPMASPIDQFGGNLPLPEQADVVFDVGYHDFHTMHFAVPGATGPLDVAGFDKAVFKALNPGGIYVVIDNAAAAGAGFSDAGKLGRSEKSAVIAEISAAGFVLEAESAALATAADNHSRAATDATLGGRPDRFALRFRKPLNSSLVNERRGDGVFEGLYGNTIVSFSACIAGPNGKMPICGLDRSEHHFRLKRDHTFEVDGLPGDDPLIRGKWFQDARGSTCLWGEDPGRGTIMCHVGEEGKHVGDQWNWVPYGVNLYRPARVYPGLFTEFGVLTPKDFPAPPGK